MFCCLILRLLYGVLLRERRSEYSALYVLGAKKREIRALVLWEGFLLGIFGAFLGVVFGTAVLIFAVLLFAGLFSPLSALLALRKTEREGYGSLL